MRTAIRCVAFTALFVISTGCSTSPKTQAEKKSLVAEADAAVASMTARDPSLRDFIDRGAGYVIFPDVGKAGAIIGGAYGRGVVFEGGRPTGFAELNQGSIGAQIGAQSYSELVVFENEVALNRFKADNFDLGAEVSAVALKAGAAGSARFEGGVAVFQHTRGGLMAAAAVNGQKLNYEPMDKSVTAGGSTRPVTTPSGEMELRSGQPADATDDATDAARSATERGEQRIEQRLEETEQRAKDAADQPK